MLQNTLQLSLKQRFSFQALCLKGLGVKRICISAQCKSKNIYLCGNNQNLCQCHYQHRNCSTINYEAFCDRFVNYKKELNKQMQEYIQRFQKVFKNLESKIKKQSTIFKSYYQKLLFGQVKSSIERKIQKKNINGLTQYQVGQFLYSLQSSSQQINCGKLSLSEAHQLDKKIGEVFSFIEGLYQKKITKKQTFTQNKKTMRSYSSSCLQKYQPDSKQKSFIHTRKSSLFSQQPGEYNKSKYLNVEQKQIFSKNLSTLLEKKTINDYLGDKSIQLRPPKINLDYPKSIPSKIISNCSMINHFIGKKVQLYELIFRASQNNFLIKDFYKEILKNKKPQNKGSQNFGHLFLIKSEFNNVFGAFTELSFQDLKSKTKQENQTESQNQVNPQESNSKKKKKFLYHIKALTFMFSIDLNEKYHLKQPQKAVYLGGNSIGFGNSDLRIKNKSNIFRQSYCRIGDSYKVNQNQHKFNVDYDTKNPKIIGSRYGKKFKINQWECFRVNYHKQNY